MPVGVVSRAPGTTQIGCLRGALKGCPCVLQELLTKRQCQFILALVGLMEGNVLQGACGTCLSFSALLMGSVPGER